MSQTNHNDCWIPAQDPPGTQRRIIIWTKRPWPAKADVLLTRRVSISRHLDMDGAWFDIKQKIWFHSDGSVAVDVTHWMEMPQRPKMKYLDTDFGPSPIEEIVATQRQMKSLDEILFENVRASVPEGTVEGGFR